MLTRFLQAAVALVLASGISCSKDPRPAGSERRQQMQDGVQVGNGLVKGQFVSKKYKYELRYDNALEPSIKSFEKVRFDNSGLRKLTDAYSVVDVQVYPEGKVLGRDIGTQPLLRQYLVAQYPGQIFNQDVLHGLPWFFYEIEQGDFKHGWHYFLTPLKDVIFVESVLGNNSVGAKMLADTLASLRFDATGPEILSVTVARATSVVGERNQLNLHITDNVVGLLPRIRGKLVLVNPTSLVIGCTATVNFSAALTGGSSEAQFNADFPLENKLCPGEYALAQLSAWDLAGNPTMLRTVSQSKPDPKGKYLGAGVHSIGVASFHVTAKPIEFDPTAPEILRLGPSLLAAASGALQTITFEASDSETGVDEYRNGWGLFQSDFKIDGRTVTFSVVGIATRIGATHFALEFRIREFLPPGEYFLKEFKVANRAFAPRVKLLRAAAKPAGGASWFYSGTNISVIRLKVTNRGPFDIVPPELVSLTVPTSQVKRGNSGTIEFTAKDDGMGVADYFEYGGVFMPLFGDGKMPGMFVDGPVRKRDGKHVLDVYVDAETALGFYALQVFKTWDGAENADEVTADLGPLMNNPATWLGRFYQTSSITKLPLQILEVIKD